MPRKGVSAALPSASTPCVPLECAESAANSQESRVVTHVFTDKISHAQAESPAPVLKRSGTPRSPPKGTQGLVFPSFSKMGLVIHH